MMIEDKERFIRTYKKDWDDDIILIINSYHDQGCLEMYIKDYDEVSLDVVFFENREGRIQATIKQSLKDEYPLSNNYIYNYNTYFPIREIIYLGYKAHIFNDYNFLLEKQYGDWNSIPQEYKKYENEKFMQSPIIMIEEDKIGEFEKLIEKNKS